MAGQPAGGDGDTLAPALRKTLLDLGVSQGFDEERVRQAVRGQTGRDLDDLPTSELTPCGAGRPQGAAEAGRRGPGRKRRAAVGPLLHQLPLRQRGRLHSGAVPLLI